MTDGLLRELQAGKREVETSPIHELSFATRKRILLELGPQLKDEQGNYTIFGPGLIRRARLCIMIVKRVLPIWDMHYPRKHPHRMIELAEEFLSGAQNRQFVKNEVLAFSGGLDTSDTPDKQPAYLVGRASVCAALVALYDEVLQPEEWISAEELANPQDPDFFDCTSGLRERTPAA